jgi:hypothetical protein
MIKLTDILRETKEVFSAYHGRYTFDVDRAYEMINSGEVRSEIKKINPYQLHLFSHKEFSFTDPKKVQRLKIDYEKPIGILVKFENPESEKTEWILIDGNHRARKAADENNSAKLHVVSDPQEVKKFMSVDTTKPHRLFADDD